MFGNKDARDTRDTKDTGRDAVKEIIREHTTPMPAPTPIRETKQSSVIGEGVSINGTMRVEGTVTILGEFEGKITCTDQLVVGKTGRVKAELEVGSAMVAGWVEGRVFARERVELATHSHLKGDVHAKSFVIQDGCFFQGNCSMGEAAGATSGTRTTTTTGSSMGTTSTEETKTPKAA